MKEIKVMDKKANGFQKYLDSKTDRMISHSSREERSVCRMTLDFLKS